LQPVRDFDRPQGRLRLSGRRGAGERAGLLQPVGDAGRLGRGQLAPGLCAFRAGAGQTVHLAAQPGFHLLDGKLPGGGHPLDLVVRQAGQRIARRLGRGGALGGRQPFQPGQRVAAGARLCPGQQGFLPLLRAIGQGAERRVIHIARLVRDGISRRLGDFQIGGGDQLLGRRALAAGQAFQPGQRIHAGGQRISDGSRFRLRALRLHLNRQQVGALQAEDGRRLGSGQFIAPAGDPLRWSDPLRRSDRLRRGGVVGGIARLVDDSPSVDFLDLQVGVGDELRRVSALAAGQAFQPGQRVGVRGRLRLGRRRRRGGRARRLFLRLAPTEGVIVAVARLVNNGVGIDLRHVQIGGGQEFLRVGALAGGQALQPLQRIDIADRLFEIIRAIFRRQSHANSSFTHKCSAGQAQVL